jgi:hypothetical protein
MELYGIFIIFSGSWLCVNTSSSVFDESEIFSCGVCFAQTRNTNVCPSQYQLQILCDQTLRLSILVVHSAAVMDNKVFHDVTWCRMLDALLGLVRP